MKNKKVCIFSLIAFVLLLVSAGLIIMLRFVGYLDGGVGTLNGREFTYGLRAAFNNFVGLIKPASYAHETGFIAIILVFVAVFSFIILLVMSILKKKPICILPAFVFMLVMGFLPFVLILTVPMVQMGVMRSVTEFVMAGVVGLLLFALFFTFVAILNTLDPFSYVKEEKPAAQPAAQPAVANGLSDEEVKAIVEDYLAKHVDELHPEGAVVAPVEEPAPEEEPEEEPVEEEPVEEDEEDAVEEVVESNDSNDGGFPAGIANKGKRRKASFETRLKNSEFDIRHKYYDLRDYIKWYGLKNRISIPGDTFSYKRQRYVFLTIVGKHIRVYIGLDPNNYSDSTIPVEAASAKKYEDLPCLLRVKSDLSYRRAKKLVDDLMAKIGLEKPDEDEPKETQKDE